MHSSFDSSHSFCINLTLIRIYFIIANYLCILLICKKFIHKSLRNKNAAAREANSNKLGLYRWGKICIQVLYFPCFLLHNDTKCTEVSVSSFIISH